MTRIHHGNNCRILIVEYMLQNMQVIASILRNDNYQLAFAQNGKTALEKASYKDCLCPIKVINVKI